MARKTTISPSDSSSSESSLVGLRDQIVSLFDRVVGSGRWDMYPVLTDYLNEGDTFSPVIEVHENDSDVVVLIELPGVDPNSLTLKVSEHIVKLKGDKPKVARDEDNMYHSERKYGRFRRTIRLPEAIDANEVQAEYSHGVLSVRLSKADMVKPRAVPIKIIKE